MEVKDIIKDKLDLKASGSLTKTNGNADYVSAVGAAADDNNAFEPEDFAQIDDAVIMNFDSLFIYKLSDILNMQFGYQYEKLKIKDFQYDGYANVSLTNAGAYSGLLTMGTLPKDYAVHAVYVKAAYKF